MFKVLVSDPISDFGIQQLYDAEDVEVIKKTGLSREDLLDIIQDVDALLVRSQTKVTADIIAAANNLKVIGRAGVGVDNIDLEEATRQGVIVINAPDGNTISTCEHTFAMMLSLARKIPQAYHKTICGEWDRKSFVGVEVRNKVLGVVGMGRIGGEVAKRAKAFGMKVIAYDPFLTEARAEKLGVELYSVDELVKRADFITVHTPLTPETRHLISTKQFQIMKKGVRILNCARGGIIDENALMQALEDGIVAGAAFDVFEQEPPEASHPFLSHPNVVVTPHLGASTLEAQENVAVDVSEEVLHILRNEPFKNAVNLPPVAPDVFQKLQPYFTLGEKMGSFLSQWIEEAVQQVHIQISGELSEVDTAPLVSHIVKGILSHSLSGVNIVNSMHLAKSRELEIVREKSSSTKGFTSLLTVSLQTNNGTKTISGTLLNGYGPRIVKIAPYSVDVAPEGRLLLVSHQDKPGIVGRFGTILGNNGVNIATMQVGRQVIGGEAVMILTVDKEVPDQVLDEMKQTPDITNVREIIL